MIIGNGISFARNPLRFRGGNAVATADGRCNYSETGPARNFYVYSAVGTVANSGTNCCCLNSIPNGYVPPYCWVMAPKAGGMAVYTDVTGASSLSINLAGGLNGTVAMAGIGDIASADMRLLIFAAATLLGTCDLSADLRAELALAVQLAGSGDLTGALGALSGAISALEGTSSLTADVRALGIVQSQLAGSGNLSATVLGIASLAATIVANATLVADIAGGIEAVASLAGTGLLSASATAILEAAATLAGQATISAVLQSVVPMTATLTGAGDLTANIAGLVQIASDIAGNATVQAAAFGHGNLTAGLTGTGSLAASTQALADMISALAGTGALTGTPYAHAYMSANITPFTELSPENLSASVWNSLATQFNTPGSMGEKLNGAASAGDPWLTALPGAYAPGTAGALIGGMPADVAEAVLNAAVEAGLTTQQAMRLITAVLVGKAYGGGTTSVRFRDHADTKNRVVLTVDVKGNRTAVSTDPS